MEVKKSQNTEQMLNNIEQLQTSPGTSDWFSDPNANSSLEMARRMRQTKMGLYASVPIICKAENCPYADSCELMQMGMAVEGQKCPIEIAAIEDLFLRYCTDIGINPEDPAQQVDAIMVKEIVDMDIAMLRVDKKMAVSADFILDSVVGMTDDGHVLTKKEVHPMMDYKEKLRTQKYKTLNLLNSTRKDKAGDKVSVHIDPSTRASEMLKLQKDLVVLDHDAQVEKQAYLDKMERLKNGQSDIIDVEPVLEVDGEEE